MACWKLNETENEDQLQERAQGLEAQQAIPVVSHIEHGPRTSQVDWAGPDDMFDYAMVVTLDNFNAVRAYPAHPLYQKLFGTILYVGSDMREFWLNV